MVIVQDYRHNVTISSKHFQNKKKVGQLYTYMFRPLQYRSRVWNDDTSRLVQLAPSILFGTP